MLPPNTEHLRLVDEVVLRLEESILSGEMRTGDRLLVVPLAQHYGTSQSTIREAFLILERRGLIKTRPRRGASVTRLSEREAFELCQARALLEGYALAEGADAVDSAMLARMQGHITAIRACNLPADLPRVIQADLSFHGEIMALCRNDALIELWSTLNGRLGALVMRTAEQRQLDVEDMARYHEEVLHVMEGRNAERSYREIVRHYMRGFDQELRLGRSFAAAILPTPGSE